MFSYQVLEVNTRRRRTVRIIFVIINCVTAAGALTATWCPTGPGWNFIWMSLSIESGICLKCRHLKLVRSKDRLKRNASCAYRRGTYWRTVVDY